MFLGVQRKHILRAGLGALALALLASSASAASYKVLHDFAGVSDGQQPSELVADSAGRLYGTTFEGGSQGGGTVFRLTKTGKTWSVETLADLSGGVLGGVLIGPSGELYGTTKFGGTLSAGTVWRLDLSGSTWTLTTLHQFDVTSGDGYYPAAGLAFGKDGLIYGTTMGQQPQDGQQASQDPMYGTVFNISPSGDATEYAQLHVFGGPNDGQFPGLGRLSIDSKGVISGTTELGGKLSDGTAFQLAPPKKKQTAWSETVLHNFGAFGDAVGPFTGLVRGRDGTLYGCATWGKNGIGAVYSLNGTSETLLYSFGDQTNDPNAASICAVTIDKTGTIYGTANSGGANAKGAVFQLTPPVGDGAWTETVLHSFGAGDGQSPSAAPLVRGKMLYGTTTLGGAGGDGAVYVLKP
jgi:uncharacterized repeat protein (TIGR03803 family)